MRMHKNFKSLILLLILDLHWQRQSNAAAPMVQRNYHNIPLTDGAIGPESIAFDCEGKGPYVGVSDGRVLKWQVSTNATWKEFAYTSPNWTRRCSYSFDSQERPCGRPLGLKFDMKTCELYIADAYYGLMVVSRHGGKARILADTAEGIPFQFTNALDIDVDARVIYFTDSSTRFQRWDFLSIISTRDSTGRLMKYDMKTQATEVLLRGLSFANGVALSSKKDFLLVTETTTGQVRRFWLRGAKSGTSDIFIQLEACPDNINRDVNGDFWIAQNPTSMFFLPPFPVSEDGGSPVKVDKDGNVLEVLDDARKDNGITASDINEFGGKLWIGSVIDNFIEVTDH